MTDQVNRPRGERGASRADIETGAFYLMAGHGKRRDRIVKATCRHFGSAVLWHFENADGKPSTMPRDLSLGQRLYPSVADWHRYELTEDGIAALGERS